MDKQTDEGDIIGRCPTDVKRPIGKCHTEICFKKWVKNRSLWYSKRHFTPGAICVICLECSQRKYFLQLFVDVHLNWHNWFHFLILEEGRLVILINCMIFQSPFLDVTRISMSTVCFLAKLNSGIICPQSAFL